MSPNAMHISRDEEVTGRLCMYGVGIDKLETKLRSVSIVRNIQGICFKCYFLPYENVMLIFIFIMDRIFVRWISSHGIFFT
jgi:hypothetical protein